MVWSGGENQRIKKRREISEMYKAVALSDDLFC